MLAHFIDDLLREPGASVEHRHHHARQLQRWIHPGVAKLVRQPGDHRNALQRIILALQRHQQIVRRRERVQGQRAQGRRAVDQDDIEPAGIHHGLQRVPHPMDVVFEARDLDVRAAHVQLAGDDFEPIPRGLLDFFGQRALAEQGPISAAALGFFQPQSACRVGLRVQVEQQHPLALRRKAGGQIDGSGGFSHAALLIGHGDNASRHARD